ncbi:MAG: hypothetical protein QMD80_08710 [archaeon]|nr:hypothetical protein [archaeon]
MDFSFIGAGMAKSLKGKLLGVMSGGGKAISTPRARSPYILYGIPNPKREYKRITELMLGLYDEGDFDEKDPRKTSSTCLNSSNGTHDYILEKLSSFRKKLLTCFLHRNTGNFLKEILSKSGIREIILGTIGSGYGLGKVRNGWILQIL